jgi:hypothetical protein
VVCFLTEDDGIKAHAQEHVFHFGQERVVVAVHDEDPSAWRALRGHAG